MTTFMIVLIFAVLVIVAIAARVLCCAIDYVIHTPRLAFVVITLLTAGLLVLGGDNTQGSLHSASRSENGR